MPKKVLITDGSSALGLSLAKALLKKEYTLTLLCPTLPVPRELKGKVTLVPDTPSQPAVLTQYLQGQDIVVHNAEISAPFTSKKILQKSNVEKTEQLLKESLSQKIKQFIYLSTTDVYGKAEGGYTEESPLNPLDTYSVSKVMAERVCLHYQGQGLPVTILRTRPVMGPDVKGPWLLWFDSLYNGKRLYLLGSGKNKFQFLALSDLTGAIISTITHQVTNTICNLGAKEYQTLRKDLSSLIRFDKSSSRISSVPEALGKPLLSVFHLLRLSPFSRRYIELFSHPTFTSITKAEKVLSWTPKKSNKELFLESYLWYKKNRKKILQEQSEAKTPSWNFKLLERISQF